MAVTRTGPRLGPDLHRHLLDGTFIPAVPLAQTSDGAFDPTYQRALTRYYVDAGAGGIAVGVHSTQFEIRDPSVGLYEPVLELVSNAVDEWLPGKTTFVKIAGIAGDTNQAVAEAHVASQLGYDIGLLSLAALKDADEDNLINHCRAVADEIPLMGFYLQLAVGGRILGYDFWLRFAEIEQVVAIKISPFNRYQTIDVVRAVANAGRLDEIALYTGNDDNIVADLLTDFTFDTPEGQQTGRIVGGLLGHWAVWTRKSVEIFNRIKAVRNDVSQYRDLLELGVQVTDSNAALFDVANSFAGCLPGMHYVLHRQGLRRSIRCLNEHERLSLGQENELERIYREYPHLTDDSFVAENLERWLR